MSFFHKSGIVNVKMVITEEKILSNIDVSLFRNPVRDMKQELKAFFEGFSELEIPKGF